MTRLAAAVAFLLAVACAHSQAPRSEPATEPEAEPEAEPEPAAEPEPTTEAETERRRFEPFADPPLLEPALVVSEQADPETQRVWLTVAGLELAHDGRREVEPFLELVRLLVGRFVQDPDGKPEVSSDDLRRTLGEDRRSEFRRLAKYYRRQWGTDGGGHRFGEDGPWFWTTDVNDLRFEHVASGAEYIRLRSGSHVVRLGDADDLHEKLLRMVYDKWHASGEWPEIVQFCVEHRGLGDVFYTLFGVLDLLIGRRVPTSRGQNIELRVDGVLFAAPGAPELSLLLDIIEAVRLEYGETYGEKSIPLDELARRVGAPIDVVRRVLFWVRNDLMQYLQVSEKDGEVSVTGRKAILKLDDFPAMSEALVLRDGPDTERCLRNLDVAWREHLGRREERRAALATGEPAPE